MALGRHNRMLRKLGQLVGTDFKNLKKVFQFQLIELTLSFGVESLGERFQRKEKTIEVQDMEKKQVYMAPAVLRKTPLDMEGEILSGSVVNNMTINSMGQDVVNYDYDFSNTDDGFNHEWN